MKSLDQPLISLCLPSLNARRFLEPRVESILAQTWTRYEVVICDSYSDDGTWEFFAKLRGDQRFQLHQVPREGLYAGWNQCLRRCSGQYIYFATADDTFAPEFLKKMVAFAESQPLTSLFCCALQPIDDQGNPLEGQTVADYENIAERLATEAWKNRPHVKTRLLSLLVALLSEPIYKSATALLVRRSIFKKAGLYPTTYGTSGDVSWSARASLFSDIAYLPERLATWRIHGDQRSQGLDERQLLQVRERILDDLAREHPEALTEVIRIVPDFPHRIAHVFRESRLATSDLHRHLLRENPQRFFRALIRAAIHDPATLLSQTRRGFAWNDFGDNLRQQLTYLTDGVPESKLTRPLPNRLTNSG